MPEPETTTEIWKRVQTWADTDRRFYEVSNFGRVRRVCICGSWIFGRYPVVALCGQRRKSRIAHVHSLVARAFIGPRPTDHQVNHKDGDRENNRPENLEYVTMMQNIRHAIKIGKIITKLTPETVREIRRRHKAGASQCALAKEFGVCRRAIGQAVSRVTWKHV
jgi:hypothetical protein